MTTSPINEKRSERDFNLVSARALFHDFVSQLMARLLLPNADTIDFDHQ